MGKNSKRQPRRTTANSYLTEPVLYGGLWSTRAEIIADLQERGGTQAMIDRYLQGLDYGLRLRGNGK